METIDIPVFETCYSHMALLFCSVMRLNNGWIRRYPVGDEWDGWFLAGTEINGEQVEVLLEVEPYWAMCHPCIRKPPQPYQESDGSGGNGVIRILAEWLRSDLTPDERQRKGLA